MRNLELLVKHFPLICGFCVNTVNEGIRTNCHILGACKDVQTVEIIFLLCPPSSISFKVMDPKLEVAYATAYEQMLPMVSMPSKVNYTNV